MADSGLTSSASGSGWLSAAAPIIGAGIDAIGSVAGGLFSANQARKNRKFQERMYNKQLEDNRENWRMVNEYNLPSAVLQRMRDAGLNPLMMYEGGAGQLVANQMAQGATAPHGDSAKMGFQTNFGQAMMQAALIKAQIRNMNADSENKEANADNARANTENTNVNTSYLKDVYQVRLAFEHGNLDHQAAIIRDLSDQMFQRNFVNGNQMASLALANNLSIQRFNLDKYQVGENIKVAWANVASGRVMANAAWKQAVTAANRLFMDLQIQPYIIGEMRARTANWWDQHEFNQKTMSFRVGQEFNKDRLGRKELSWYDIMREVGCAEADARMMESGMRRAQMQNNMDWQDFNNAMDNLMYKPLGLLLNFGGKTSTRMVQKYDEGSYTSTHTGYDWSY